MEDIIWAINVKTTKEGLSGKMVRCSCHGTRLIGNPISLSSKQFRFTIINTKEIRAKDNQGAVFLIKFMG